MRELSCEMCGKETGTRRYLVERTEMRLCSTCGRYGRELDAPPKPGPAAPGAPARVPARRPPRDIFAESEDYALVGDWNKRIQTAREAKGWTREMLGGKVSARVPELASIEAGHLHPSDDLVKRLERELSITLREKVPVASMPKPAGAAATRSFTIGDLIKPDKKPK